LAIGNLDTLAGRVERWSNTVGAIESHGPYPRISVGQRLQRFDWVSQRCGHNHLAVEGLVDWTAVGNLD
jgi:hypothetical protein